MNNILILIIGAILLCAICLFIGMIIGNKNNKKTESISREDLQKYFEHNVFTLRQDMNKTTQQIGQYINKIVNPQKTNLVEIKTILNLLNDTYANDRQKDANTIANLEKITDDMNRLFNNSKEFGTVSENLLSDLLSLSYLEDINYFKQFILKDNSKEKVDFAILVPTKNNKIYLPIDSKFPKDSYLNYINNQSKDNYTQFKTTIKTFAKDINSKYIIEGKTTNFAIMYIPTDNILQLCFKDNLYFEIFNEYKVIICSPTTIIPIIEILKEFYSQYELETQLKQITDNLKTIDKSSNSIKEDVSYITKKLENISKNADKLSNCKINNDDLIDNK